MTASNLPFEIQQIILSHLNSTAQIQYSLVSKHWRAAAKHVLFDTIYLPSGQKVDECVDLLLVSSPLGEFVKKLVFLTCASLNEAKQYSSLIHLTPNLKVLATEKSSNRLFQTAIQEVRSGHWKHLHSIGDLSIENDYDSVTEMGTEPFKSSVLDYYALASVLQDRLSAFVFDITSIDNSSVEPYCFQLPLYITRQTRFNALKDLICFSQGTTTIESLDDTLALCQNATEVKLSVHHFRTSKERWRQIEPNASVKSLSVFVTKFTEASLGYIYRKFSAVKQLTMHALDHSISNTDETIDPLEVPVDMKHQLAYYVHSTTTSDIWFYGINNSIELFLAFVSMQWPGEMQINLESNLFQLQHDSSKPKHSELHIDLDIGGLNVKQATLRDYLNQLDVLSIGPIDVRYYPLLAQCTRIRVLRMYYGNPSGYQGPTLAISRLILFSEDYNANFLKEFSASTPNLRHVNLVLCTFGKIEIDTPCVSYDSLCVENLGWIMQSSVCLLLIRSGIQSYYKTIENRLCEIGIDEFKGQAVKMDRAKVELICNDIKRLEIHWRVKDSGRVRILHDFY
ncbi:hypothetical protein A0J61_08183 [Choanephora cucurbitarum]|uniref:F-box domain-containing protein n=1 Tax=Choanephora cucurbitarum TaxID=101091 RepID=A0A1C7N3Z9_9FUNG|nr:hypothetical protein A0J61_08183 [Choanephora cucurbitarum]